MPAGYDAEVAELFRDLRSASGLSEADLAAQLATRPEVVQALEQGALYALPPWPETYRVVATYGTLLNLDVRPLLRRIYAQVEAGIVGLAPKAMPEVPFMAPPEGSEREFQGRAPMSAPPVAEPPPMQPRQPAPPQPRVPQAAPNRQAPARQVQAPQFRPQPQPQLQSHPQHQPPPRWPPQPRGAPPAAPPRGAPAPPRSTPAPQREARAPSPPQQPHSRTAPPPRTAPLEEKPPQKALPWNALVKWGVVILVILAIAAGLWMWLAKPGLLGSSGPSGQPGAKSSNKGAPPTDPNDPRSRKADRLPGPS
jgi:Helix-turn-helix domain